VAFPLALLGIVVLHELGHALSAKRFAVRTRDITLLPIGGVVRLEWIPEVPSKELLIAVAGPAVNVVLASGILVVLRLLGQGVVPPGEAIGTGGGFWQQMLWVNVWLVIFNLIPAFPMDGGRVLRALLAMRIDYVRTTQTAAAVGQVIAMVFALLGLFGNLLLILIEVFVWLAGTQEAGVVVVRSALAGIPVLRVMITDFRSLQPDDPLSRAVGYILAVFQQDFPVVAGDRPVGILTRNDLATAFGRYGPETPVTEVMQREFVTTDPHDMQQTAFDRLQQGLCRTLPVVRDGHLVGLLTADNLAEVLMIQQTLREADRHGPFGRPPRPAEPLDRSGRPARDISVP
jgi:Zn-dependent protease/predicted transcriptional regulator